MLEKTRAKIANKIYKQPEAKPEKQKTVGEVFTDEDIDICREWFGCVQDINPNYLEKKDFVLAEKLYKFTGFRVTNSIKAGLEEAKEVKPPMEDIEQRLETPIEASISIEKSR